MIQIGRRVEAALGSTDYEHRSSKCDSRGNSLEFKKKTCTRPESNPRHRVHQPALCQLHQERITGSHLDLGDLLPVVNQFKIGNSCPGALVSRCLDATQCLRRRRAINHR